MIPNYLEDVKAAKVKYADAWTHAHVTGDPRAHEWIKLFAADLHAKDPNAGLNGKRGNPNDLSMDAINYLDPVDGPGLTPDGKKCWVVDVIRNAGISSAEPVWGPFDNPVASTGAWVKPGAAEPVPVPVPQYPSYEELGGDEGGKKITRQLDADFKAAGRPSLDKDCGAWQQRVSYDFLTRKIATVEDSIKKHRDEWLEALQLIQWTPSGPQSISYTCKICGATSAGEIAKPMPPIPHKTSCTI